MRGEEQLRGRQDAEQLREAQELEEQHYAEQPRHRAEQERTRSIKKKPDLTHSELLRKRQKMARGHG